MFAVALWKHPALAVDMIELLNLDDVQDELSHEQNAILDVFSQQLRSSYIDLKNLIVVANRLCSISGLSDQAKGYALAYRATLELLNGKTKQALHDIENALHYIPDDAQII